MYILAKQIKIEGARNYSAPRPAKALAGPVVDHVSQPYNVIGNIQHTFGFFEKKFRAKHFTHCIISVICHIQSQSYFVVYLMCHSYYLG